MNRLSFFNLLQRYNMNGNNIGSLTVYAVTGGVQTPLWQLSGQQSGQWNFGRVSVLSPNSTFKVIRHTSL